MHSISNGNGTAEVEKALKVTQVHRFSSMHDTSIAHIGQVTIALSVSLWKEFRHPVFRSHNGQPSPWSIQVELRPTYTKLISTLRQQTFAADYSGSSNVSNTGCCCGV